MSDSSRGTGQYLETGPTPVTLAVDPDNSIPVETASGLTLSGDTAWTDWIGIVASIGCAIHCAAMPFAIALLPSLGVSFLADQSVHRVMAVTCSVIAAVAFVPGWRLHRSLLPISVAGVGLTLITGAAFLVDEDCCAACVLPTEASSVACVLPTESASEACDDHCHDHNHAEHEHSLAAGGHCCEHEHEEHGHAAHEHAEHDHGQAAQEHAEHADCCEHEHAEHEHCCEQELAEHEEPALSPPAETAEFASLIPFVTPLGGLLLVSAHLTNRRFSCRCGCCEADSEDAEAA